MKILQITNSSTLSGGVFQMLELTKNLVRKGHDVTIACRAASQIKKIAVKEGIAHVEFAMRRDADIRTMYKLYRYLRREKFDVVHAHHPKAHMVAMIAALFARTPVFVVSRRVSFSIKEGKNIFNPLKYRFFRVNMILPVCASITRMLIGEGVKKSKVRTVYSSTDQVRFDPDTVKSGVRKELGIANDAIVITKIAHCSEWKGYDYLLRAARSVLSHNKDVKFIVAGSDTNTDAFHKKVNNMGLAGSFYILGRRPDVPELLQASDIAVNAAYAGEGLSGALREALFMRVPVVATDISGNKEVCLDGETGYLVPVKDDIALANALITLTDDKETRQRMGARGREFVLKNFTPDIMTDKTLEVYKELLGKKGSG